MERNLPSLYETLLLNFSGGLGLHAVAEVDQPLLSLLDNLQRILNSRAGALAHLPGYGLPDLSQWLQGSDPAGAGISEAICATLLAHEPRLAEVRVLPPVQVLPGHWGYTLHVRLVDGRRARFATTFNAEGRVLLRHLRAQGLLAQGGGQ